MLGQTRDELVDAPQKRRAGVLGHSPDVLDAPPSKVRGHWRSAFPPQGSHAFAVELLPQPASSQEDLGAGTPLSLCPPCDSALTAGIPQTALS